MQRYARTDRPDGAKNEAAAAAVRRGDAAGRATRKNTRRARAREEGERRDRKDSNALKPIRSNKYKRAQRRQAAKRQKKQGKQTRIGKAERGMRGGEANWCCDAGEGKSRREREGWTMKRDGERDSGRRAAQQSVTDSNVRQRGREKAENTNKLRGEREREGKERGGATGNARQTKRNKEN